MDPVELGGPDGTAVSWRSEKVFASSASAFAARRESLDATSRTGLIGSSCSRRTNSTGGCGGEDDTSSARFETTGFDGATCADRVEVAAKVRGGVWGGDAGRPVDPGEEVEPGRNVAGGLFVAADSGGLEAATSCVTGSVVAGRGGGRNSISSRLTVYCTLAALTGEGFKARYSRYFCRAKARLLRY